MDYSPWGHKELGMIEATYHTIIRPKKMVPLAKFYNYIIIYKIYEFIKF